MSEPLRLHMHSPAGPTAPLLIGACHASWDNMPSLWQLLLSDAAPMAPSAAFPDTSPAVAADAREALERYHFLTWRIGRHPVLPRLPTLPVFLDGALCFLRDCRRHFPLDEQDQLVLVASDADGDAPGAAFFAHARQTWELVQEMGGHDTWFKLDHALRFRDRRMHVGQWRAWAKTFGLETLSHPYFARLDFSLYYDDDMPPPTVRHYRHAAGRPDTPWSTLKKSLRALLPGVQAAGAPAANDPEPQQPVVEGYDGYDIAFGERSTDPWEGTAFRPVHVNGKVGLRFVPAEAVFSHLDMDQDEYVDPDPARLALEPVWDELLLSSHLRAWARRGDAWGLIVLHRHCRVLLEPCVDSFVQEPDSWAAHVLKDGLRGLVCTEAGTWQLAPQFDEMRWSDEGAGAVWRVRQGERWGLVSSDGELRHPVTLDCMPDYDDGHGEGDLNASDRGFHLTEQGRAGWARPDGTVDLACAFDAVKPCRAEGLYAVRRGAGWGLATAGNVLLPCDFLAVTPLILAAHVTEPDDYWSVISDDCWPSGNVADLLAGADPARSNLLVGVRTATGSGVVDQAGRVIVPARYASVSEVRNGSHGDPRWLHLEAANGRRGLWSVADACEVFPCVHDAVHVYVAPGFVQPLVGTVNQGVCRLWQADASPAFEEAFRWISGSGFDGTDMDGHDSWMDLGRVTEAWHEGRSARAGLADAACTRVFLQPGQPVRSFRDSLAHAYEAQGNLDAALELATDYYYQQEYAQARAWAARACGHTPLPPGAPSQLRPRTPEQTEKAAELFAELLDGAKGGPRDAVLARQWAGTASARGLLSACSAKLLLGKLLLDPAAGKVDTHAAWEALDTVSPTGSHAPMAGFYKARCLLSQSMPDTDMAVKLLAQADAIGVDEATAELARLLESMAARAGFRDKKRLRQEAMHYLDKQAYYREFDDDDDNEDEEDES